MQSNSIISTIYIHVINGVLMMYSIIGIIEEWISAGKFQLLDSNVSDDLEVFGFMIFAVLLLVFGTLFMLHSIVKVYEQNLGRKWLSSFLNIFLSPLMYL